jgi:ubiquinone/menaquinone biosynthesis C-methylase UbiE
MWAAPEAPTPFHWRKAGIWCALIDLHEPHVEAAAVASAVQPDAPRASVAEGDARELPFADASADAVLLLGPLHHLPEA